MPGVTAARWVRRGLARRGQFVLLLALLPSLLYLGHWGELVQGGDALDGAEEARHESHCHFGPASCSGQPLSGGVRLAQQAVELPEPDLPTVLLYERVAALDEFIVPPVTQPPRL